MGAQLYPKMDRFTEIAIFRPNKMASAAVSNFNWRP